MRILILTSVCALALCVPAMAQEALVRMEIPSSPNPVGSGARALGMGGAFIAIADDATAASWNPGGLINLQRPEFSVVFDYTDRSEDNIFRDNPEASGPGSITDYSLNYMSVAYPWEIGWRKMIVSLNYQHLYDFNQDWHFNMDLSDPTYVGLFGFDYEQEGGLYALGLAYSGMIAKNFYLGVTLNYWGDFLYENEWEQKYFQQGSNIFPPPPISGGLLSNFTRSKTETFGFSGWNANIGFLWRISEHLTLGGVIKTQFSADIDHLTTRVTNEAFPTQPAFDTNITTMSDSDDELEMPMSYGLGVAYRFSDALTIAGDIYRTQWDDFEYKSANGSRTSPISGEDMANSDVDPTTWFRLGAEYIIVGTKTDISIHGGVFYDPAPAEGSPNEYYGFALGSGLAYELKEGSTLKSFVFDVAYQFRFGDDVGPSILEELNYSQDVQEHKVYASLVLHF